MAKITVQNTNITIIKVDGEDYVSITDLARHKSDEPTAVIGNWMRNRNTIEFLGIWESLYNPDFKPLEFEGFKKQAGLNAFTLSPKKWIDTTNAIGLISKSGRYGSTYAHKDIAFKFASWISVEFELYIVKEFQRLKAEEQKALGWSAKRELSKINGSIMTTKNQYTPRKVSHPGVTLGAKIQEMGMSVREFAIRTAKPEKTILAVIRGDSSITPDMAVIFENVTQIPAHFWMSRQRLYDEFMARQRMAQKIEESELSEPQQLYFFR